MVGLYIRVSTEGQADNYSVATQIQLGIAFATERREDFQIYQEAVSGTSRESRVKFEEMITDIKAGKITSVWVVSSSRLQRNLKDSIEIREIFKKYIVDYYVNGTLRKFQTAEDELAANVQSSVDDYQAKKTAEDSVRGKSKWQNKGMMVVPNLYGYKAIWDEQGKKTIVPDPNEVEIIKLIYKLYTEDLLPYNQIMLYLNDKGYKTKLGNMWNRSQIKKILSQTLYLRKAWTTTGEEIPSNVYLAIIEESLFQKAQEVRISTTKKRGVFQSRKASFELTSIIKCELCGAPYYYNTNYKTLKSGEKKQWERYYHAINSTAYKNCKQKTRLLVKKNVELQISNLAVTEFVENDERYSAWLLSYRKRAGNEIQVIEQTIVSWKTRILDIDKRKQNLVEAIADETISRQDVKPLMVELNRQKSELEDKIIEQRQVLEEFEANISDENYRSVVELALHYNELPTEKRRLFYQSIFKSIIVNDGKIVATMYDDSTHRFLVDNSRSKEKKNGQE